MKKPRRLLLLLLCALMALSASLPAVQAEPAYATLDDLPIVTVSRPDMAPFEIGIAVDGNLIRVSTPSGKNEFDQVSLSLRNNLEVNEQALKWDNKTKSYVLEVSDPGLLSMDTLSRYSIILSAMLEKDKKIDKQIAARFILWDFNAATGDFNRVVYTVQIGDEQAHTLLRVADGRWFYIGGAQSSVESVFFDKEGKAYQPPAVVAPETAREIQGLPNMAPPPITVKLPRGADEHLEILMEKGEWEEAEFYYLTDKGNGRIYLYYEDTAQAYRTAPWDFGSEIMFMQNAGFNNSYGVLIDWVAYLGEHNSRLQCRWQSTAEQVAAYLSGQSEQLEGVCVTSYKQNDATGYILVYQAYQQNEEELYVAFADQSTGILTWVEKTYPAMTNP